MRHRTRRLMVSGVLFSVGALWVGGAQAQRFTGSNDTASTGMMPPPAGVGRSAAAAPSAAEAPRPTAAEIVARLLEMNRERQDALEHYESQRTYRVEYAGTGGAHRAEIEVHAEYLGANQKRLTVVSESGSKFICDRVLRKLVESEQEASAQSNRMQTTLGPENYDAELVGEETIVPEGESAGVRAWVLEVTPKVDNKFTYRGKVWVSEGDYAVVRILGAPAKNPSWWINAASFDSRYVRRGDVWLPAKNVSSSHVRIGGEATLTIDYGTYPVITAHALKPAAEGPVTVASISH